MRTYLWLFVILVMFGCQKAKNETSITTEAPKEKPLKKAVIHKGKRLMQITCNSCHSPTASENNRLAPPMIAVKRRYKEAYPSKAEFTEAIRLFINTPTEENAIMYGAVERFGVMPKSVYPDNILNQIIDHLYTNEVEKPDWFEAHYKENSQKRTRIHQKMN